MLVKENINFERGINPKKSLSIGVYPIIEKWFEDHVPDTEFYIDKKMNIYIENDFNLVHSDIKIWPGNLIVKGDMNIIESNILFLPKVLDVWGILYIENTPIKMLSDKLSVGKSLYIEKTNISSIPKNINVGGNIYKDF